MHHYNGKLHALVAALLVAGLLWAQFAAFSHQHDQNTGADVLCAVCVSGEHLAHGVPRAGHSPLPSAVDAVITGAVHRDWFNTFRYTPLSRAPPHVL